MNKLAEEVINTDLGKQLFYDSSINQGLLLEILKSQARIMHQLEIESGSVSEIYEKLENEAMKKGDEIFKGSDPSFR